MRSFIIYTLHIILLRRCNHGRLDWWDNRQIRNPYRILVGKPLEKRQLEKSGRILEYTIKTYVRNIWNLFQRRL